LIPLASEATAAVAPSLGEPDTGGPAWLSTELAKVVVILLGLILIVAGLFSFQKVHETAVVIGKNLGAVAEAA
jgi:hypothetical protein